jgi:hypothetical protein
MNMEILELLSDRDEEISTLRHAMMKLTCDNAQMNNTINKLISLRCKRGQISVTLNINLIECIQKNIKVSVEYVLLKEYDKVVDMFVDLVLHALTGHANTDIPCSVLDTNNIIYKKNDLYVVASNREFTNILQHEIRKFVMTIRDQIEMNEMFVNCVPVLLDISKFSVVVKKALRIYTNL